MIQVSKQINTGAIVDYFTEVDLIGKYIGDSNIRITIWNDAKVGISPLMISILVIERLKY